MFDGIRIRYEIEDFYKWLDEVKINPTVQTEFETFSPVTKQFYHYDSITYKAKFETYKLTILEVIKPEGNKYYLTIDGSLHKNYFGGQNHSRFDNIALNREMECLCQRLKISSEKATITNLEFGVNIILNEPPTEFVKKNLLLHKTKPFVEYNQSNGIVLGSVARHTQYSVKAYDKGLQNNLKENLFRFELRFTNMEKLRKKGILTLSDLQNQNKTFALGNMLLKAWDNILLRENEITKHEISRFGQFKDYWTDLNAKDPIKFRDNREKYRKLHDSDGQKIIRNLIEHEWHEMTVNSENLKIVA